MLNKETSSYSPRNYLRLYKINLSFFLAILLLTSSMMIVSAGDTIIVDDDGTADFATIQAAINSAGIGDTIVVKDGTYAEQISIPLSIDLVAASGETPVIYSISYSYGIDVSAPDVTIEGFEIFGNISDPESGLFPAIRGSSGSSGLYIAGNTFKTFTGNRGNLAILIQGSVSDVEIINNDIINYDKGVSLNGDCQVQLQLNTFLDVNTTVHRGAYIVGGVRDKYYGSLQTIINEANSYYTIQVTPGRFVENIIIDKPITLLGEHAGIAGYERTWNNETIIDGSTTSPIIINPGTKSVEINGFSLTILNKDSSSNQAGVVIAKNTSNIDIKNNIILDISDGSGIDTINDETYGIMVYGKDSGIGQHQITIQDNYITNVEEYGIAINDNTSDVFILDNHITEMIGSDHTADPFWDPTWPAVICSAIHLGGQVGPISEIIIDGNVLQTNNTGNGISTTAGAGISFGGVADWALPSRIWEGFNQVEIKDCKIQKNSIGIIPLVGNFTDMLEVHGCSLDQNTQYAIDTSYVTQTINATNNWWGNISGPYHPVDNINGTGVNVTDNVTFWPWYEFDAYSIPPDVDFEIGFPKVDNGAYVTDDTPFTISAEDDQSGLKQIEYRIWNTTYRWSPWKEYNWTFTLNDEGKHKIQYNATDNAGTKAMGTSTHYVDIRGPWVELYSPLGGEYIQGPLMVTWNAADLFIDQQQILYTNGVSLTNDYPGHIQSFQPTSDILNSIELLMSGDEATITVVIFSEIDPVPIPIGQTTKTVSDLGVFPDWVVFNFDSTIPLDSEETYYIGITQVILGDTGCKWYYYNSSGTENDYLYGEAWVKKIDSIENKPDWDFSFKTNYWDKDNVYVDIQYTNSIPEIWSTIAEEVLNTGVYTIDTTSLPDSNAYKIRVLTKDAMGNLNSDESEGPFTIDHDGIAVMNIEILDTTISSSEYTKNGDRLEISADFFGEVNDVYADLTTFGKGTMVEPNSIFEGTATWVLNNITCLTANGENTVEISVFDPTGDSDSSTGSIMADNKEPEITMLKPLPGIYLFDSQRLLPYPYPFVFGQITMRAQPSDDISGIEQVEFYIDDMLRETVISEPYEFLWDEAAIGFYSIKAIAYDTVGNSNSALVQDVFIMNLDVWD